MLIPLLNGKGLVRQEIILWLGPEFFLNALSFDRSSPLTNKTDRAWISFQK